MFCNYSFIDKDATNCTYICATEENLNISKFLYVFTVFYSKILLNLNRPEEGTVQRLQMINVINNSQTPRYLRSSVDEAQNPLQKDNTGEVGNLKWK